MATALARLREFRRMAWGTLTFLEVAILRKPLFAAHFRLASRCRQTAAAIALVVAALATLGCTPTDFLYYAFGAVIQADLPPNMYSPLWSQTVTTPFELDCAVTNIGVA